MEQPYDEKGAPDDEPKEDDRAAIPRAAPEGEQARGDAAGEGGSSDRDSREHSEGQEGQVADVPESPPRSLSGSRTPLFYAQHSDRYARQELIRSYEEEFNCRLVVMTGEIFWPSVTYFEELIWDADATEDLHLLLDSPGGDGETAIRLIRSAQSRCRELTVIVPDQAKSAGTIVVLGAHCVLMGPTSDLGPVDPQFPQPNGRGLYAAKDLIAAVDHAEQAIANNPDSYPLHAALLADVTAVMVQQARSALGRTEDLVREALASNPDRSKEEVDRIAAALKEKLIDLPRDHGAVFGAQDARAAELPVLQVEPWSDQWRTIWRLWAKYFMLQPASIYEGRYASQVIAEGDAFE